MNRRILLSGVSLFFSAAVIAGATFAFFSDTETSTGNIFEAGDLDLKIDNTSYYNGVLSRGTTWLLDNLPGHLFFNFTDLKPGDEGEDTVSFHVTNDSWLCADIAITENDDVNCTPSEDEDEGSGVCNANTGDLFDGELAQNLEFAFWADDGDNVFEQGEIPLAQGLASDVLGGKTYALADMNGNVFTGTTSPTLDPLVPGTIETPKVYYLGKAWCFGEIGEAPVSQDGPVQIDTGTGLPTNGPDHREGGSGMTCDGSSLNNTTQTDRLMGDISFRGDSVEE